MAFEPTQAPIETSASIATPVIQHTPSVPPTAEQTPTSAKTADATAEHTPAGRDVQEMAILESQFAETMYERIQSARNRNLLVAAYEKVLVGSCFKDVFPALEYAGPPSDERCLTFIEKLLALDGSNPPALCARYGVNSEPCREGFQLQRIEVLGDQLVGGDEFDQLTAKTSEARSAQILSELRRMLEDRKKVHAAEKAPHTAQEVRRMYHRMLEIACAVSRLDLRPLPPTSPPRLRAPRPTVPPRDPRPVEEMLAELAGEKTPEAAQPERENGEHEAPHELSVRRSAAPDYERIRLLSQDCLDIVKDAFKFDAFMATAICHRGGFYTPACLDAVKAERARQREILKQSTPGARSPPATPKSGLTTF